jgi:hypothetical protein
MIQRMACNADRQFFGVRPIQLHDLPRIVCLWKDYFWGRPMVLTATVALAAETFATASPASAPDESAANAQTKPWLPTPEPPTNAVQPPYVFDFVD